MNTIKLNTIGERPTKKGGASGGGGMKYYRYDGDQEKSKNYTFDSLLWIFCAAKIQWHERSNDESSDDSWIEESVSGKVSVWSPIWVYDTNWEQIDLLAFAVDENARFYKEWSDEWVSVKDRFSQALDEGIPVTEITKEEFYKIEAPAPKFSILHHGGGENITIHEYEKGMTWGEWVNSDYNTINALISDRDQVEILIPNKDFNATLGSPIDGWLYSDNIIKSEQYDAYY